MLNEAASFFFGEPEKSMLVHVAITVRQISNYVVTVAVRSVRCQDGQQIGKDCSVVRVCADVESWKKLQKMKEFEFGR